MYEGCSDSDRTVEHLSIIVLGSQEGFVSNSLVVTTPLEEHSTRYTDIEGLNPGTDQRFCVTLTDCHRSQLAQLLGGEPGQAQVRHRPGVRPIKLLFFFTDATLRLSAMRHLE
jgi:hypothetical protein